MAQWAVTIPADQWATERLYHNETVTLTGSGGAVAPDEEVLLVADDQVVALTRAVKADGDDLVLAYLRRAFDAPVPAAGLAPSNGTPVKVEEQAFRRLVAALGGETAPSVGPGTPTWLVSVG